MAIRKNHPLRPKRRKTSRKQVLGTTKLRRKQHNLLFALTRNEIIDEGDIFDSLKLVTEIAALGLNIPRASVWSYDANRTSIVCLDLYEKSRSSHSQGLKVRTKRYPSLFRNLENKRVIAVHNAHQHPATSKLSESYFKPLGIKSVLGVSIRKSGKVVGLLCFEHIGPFRRWSLADQEFARAIADVLSRVFIAACKRTAQAKLEELNENLERIILERTRELEAQRAVMIQAAKLSSLGEMSAGIAHEINTPLAAIQIHAGQITLLTEEVEVDRIELIKQATSIEDTVGRIVKIINALKTFSRNTSHDNFEVVSVKNLVNQTLHFCQQKILNSKIDLKIEVPEDLTVECLDVQIQQVLLNLLGNSLDALEGLKGPKWIRIQSRLIGDTVEMRVTDNGRGIALPNRNKIMQPFFTTKEVGQGQGLGLSVALGIVQSHKGHLILDMQDPNTSFKITLPQFRKSSTQAA